MDLIIQVVAVVISVASLVVSLVSRSKKRSVDGLEIARIAVIAAKDQHPEFGEFQLKVNAVERFKIIDMKDGRRDFSDAKIRVLVDAAFAMEKK